MRKAYRQFMPGATNVILICSSHVEDAEDFATALLGSHIERWDAHPPQGRRVAHGRDADGFWHGIPVGLREEANRRVWQWEEIARQGARVEVQETLRERTEAIRVRRERERAAARGDTIGVSR